jgi:hypothetical protein
MAFDSFIGMIPPFDPPAAWAGPLQPEHVLIKTIVRSDRAHWGVKKRLSMGAMSVRLALFCCAKNLSQ